VESQVAHLGLVDRLGEAVVVEYRRDVEEGSGDGGDRDPVEPYLKKRPRCRRSASAERRRGAEQVPLDVVDARGNPRGALDVVGMDELDERAATSALHGSSPEGDPSPR